MTIKSNGGVFGRNPSFNDLEAERLTVDNIVADGNQISTTTGDLDLSPAGQTHSTKKITVNAKDSTASALGIEIDGANRLLTLFRTTSFSAGVLGNIVFRPGAQPTLGAQIEGYQPGAPDTADLRFYTSYGTKALRATLNHTALDLNGVNLKLSDGKGIDFSATSGTGTSELFDDYEEGTWTPTGCGAGAVGVYTKIGDTVFAYCEVKANSVSTDTIGGLPFTVGAGNSAIGGYFGRARFAGIFDANGNEVRIRMLGTEIKFMNNGGLAGDAAATITTAAGGIVQLAISVIYKV